MTLLDNIVEVKITKSSGGLIPISFNSLLIIGDSVGKIRYKTYSNLLEIGNDYESASPEFKAAQLAFGQSVRLDKVIIGQVFDEETFEQAYRIIAEEYPNFYAVIITSKEVDDQLKIASLVETEHRIFGISSNNTDILDEKNTSHILHKLKELSLSRTFVIYSSQAKDGIFPEAAWFGLMLTKKVGSATWKFKALSGFATDYLSSSKIAAIEANNGNYFCALAGRAVMFNGKMANGEYIDVIAGLDWVTAELQTQVGNALVSSEKIPFTSQGIAVIEQAIHCSLSAAASRDIIDKESIKITVPDIFALSQTDRENRNLTGIKIEARLSGAIHKLKIQGTISN
jgi:hypothetical protein